MSAQRTDPTRGSGRAGLGLARPGQARRATGERVVNAARSHHMKGTS